MKKYFLVFLSLLAALNLARADADPGPQYANAFILLQDGQAAEQNSDWGAAFQKYNSAIEILRGIRKDAPGWNPHVVEYRLKDINDKLEAVRGKVPAAPPVAAPAVVDPALTAVRAELEQAKAENARLHQDHETQLKSQGDKAEATPKVKALKQANQQLAEKLSSRDREIDSLKQKLAAQPAESPELKKLRSELADAKSNAEKNRAGQQREVAKLQQDNQALRKQLAAAKAELDNAPKSQAAAPKVAPAAAPRENPSPVAHAAAPAAPKAAAPAPKQNFGPAPATPPIPAPVSAPAASAAPVAPKAAMKLPAPTVSAAPVAPKTAAAAPTQNFGPAPATATH